MFTCLLRLWHSALHLTMSHCLVTRTAGAPCRVSQPGHPPSLHTLPTNATEASHTGKHQLLHAMAQECVSVDDVLAKGPLPPSHAPALDRLQQSRAVIVNDLM